MERKQMWKKKKRYGNMKCKIRKEYQNILKCNLKDDSSAKPNENDNQVRVEFNEGSAVSNTNIRPDYGNSDIEEIEAVTDRMEVISDTSDVECNGRSSFNEEFSTFLKNATFREELRHWAVKFNIPLVALADLSKVLNERIPNILPIDPRTILNTPRNMNLKTIEGGGQYWHNGVIFPLTEILHCWVDNIRNVDSIQLNFNVDGLPIHKSSKQEFWPILCNIFEIPDTHPFIIGIYYGSGKPKNLDAYLNEFVDEMLLLLENGIHIEELNKTIKVNIRCFICDSPARAFVKGVCNFNGRHGCMKCTTVGDYSHKSHTVTFPQTNCPNRTNDYFRQKKYGAHHKIDSPLLKLPIDMVEDFVVGDSLHLIDLGIMKRLLTGWRDGNFGKYLTKWCARDINTVNIFLGKCKMPSEIHRTVRQLDTLAYWKATEFRTFFFYLSTVILPDLLSDEVYEHFLALFCAVTICSTNKYKLYLPLSKTIMYKFVENYKYFYGADYITSNVHNLSHVTDEVERFGPLETFNAYPFENKLYLIKNMLRQGNKALSQVAKRLTEGNTLIKKPTELTNPSEFLILKKSAGSVLKCRHFEISTKTQDKYLMTNKNDIIEFEKVSDDTGEILVHGNKFVNKMTLFDTPIRSTFLNIYKVSPTPKINVVLTPNDIMCKLVCIEHKAVMHVFPLLHTFL